MLLPCPCCGYQTLTELDAYELCPVCFWEDDPHQSQDATFALGANGTSLIEAQRTYLRIGAMHPVFVKKVRRPKRGEGRDPGWHPLARPSGC